MPNHPTSGFPAADHLITGFITRQSRIGHGLLLVRLQKPIIVFRVGSVVIFQTTLRLKKPHPSKTVSSFADHYPYRVDASSASSRKRRASIIYMSSPACGFSNDCRNPTWSELFALLRNSVPDWSWPHHSSMIPLFSPFIAAWVRSLAPSLDRMFFTRPFTVSSVTFS